MKFKLAKKIIDEGYNVFKHHKLTEEDVEQAYLQYVQMNKERALLAKKRHLAKR